jgi:hypothetical protein
LVIFIKKKLTGTAEIEISSRVNLLRDIYHGFTKDKF